MNQIQEPTDEPSKRQWLGYWSMIVQQTQNAFNDKAAQFILIPLGGAVGLAVESAAGLMIALPFVMFAPLAGWMSDRFSKRSVILGAAIAQVFVLGFITLSILAKNLQMALVGFFLLAVQSAFFSPAKMGINKELLGSKHIGFASGVQQMTSMLALLAGQIVGGWWFDDRLNSDQSNAWQAALIPLIWLTFFSMPAVLMALLIPKVPSHKNVKLSAKLLTRHFIDLAKLWADLGLRRASFGVAYFWGFGAFINLWSIKMAKLQTHGGAGFGTLSSKYMAAASLGMAAGFGVASLLLRKRVELGWVPLSGMAMAIFALVLACLEPSSGIFYVSLSSLAFFAALFLAPLNAWMQDRYPANQRGELQSAVNLQNCFAGIISVLFIELTGLALSKLGAGDMQVYRMQMLMAGLCSGVMSVFIIRILPADFTRLLCSGLVRIFYRIKTIGFEKLPLSGGVLLLPNHVTFADAFFISVATERRVRFVMDESFMASRVVRLSARLFGTVAIRRDQPLEAIRITIEALAQGDVVVLFAEGQLTRTGGLSALERGFELIARKAMCPIFPMWVDGAWGSIFSFERGKFFRKIPYRLPYGLSIALGEEVLEKVNREALRDGLLKASSKAVAARFLGKNDARLKNAHQLAQLGAFPRNAELHVLVTDLHANLCDTLKTYVKIRKSRLVSEENYQAGRGKYWIGGNQLRAQLEACSSSEGSVCFYDFGTDALRSIQRDAVEHYPCLERAGMVIAMSFPHPQQATVRCEFQSGNKHKSWGKLLPGWYVEDDKVFPGAYTLPCGTHLDDECFLISSLGDAES